MVQTTGQRQYFQISRKDLKIQKATVLLRNGEYLNALLEIEEVLQSYPIDDQALTIRGKIYLALAGGKPSSNVRKAFLDFEAALAINSHNQEATEFRDAILMESMHSFTKKNMPEKAKAIQDHLGNRSLSVATEAFLESIKKEKVIQKKKSYPVETDASSSHPSPAANLEEEPKDI